MLRRDTLFAMQRSRCKIVPDDPFHPDQGATPVLQRSDLVAFMSSSELGHYLARVERGGATSVHAWVVDGLRDNGLLDHHDRVTERGRHLLGK